MFWVSFGLAISRRNKQDILSIKAESMYWFQFDTHLQHIMFLQGRNDKIEATHVAKAAIIMTGLWSCLGFRNSLSLGEKLRMNFSINYTYLQEIFNFLKSSLSLEGNCRSQDLHKQNTEYARLMDSC